MKNRFRLNLFRFVLLLSVCVSCSQEYDKALEDALNLAGENRPELEKVLRHYHGDTLKLEVSYSEYARSLFFCRHHGGQTLL